MEQGLHRDGREASGSEALCSGVSVVILFNAMQDRGQGTRGRRERCHTLLGPFLAALPDLLLRVALAHNRVFLTVHACG